MKSIKRARMSKGLTQEKLAYKVGVTQQAVSLWELGESHPREASAKKLDRILFTTK